MPGKADQEMASLTGTKAPYASGANLWTRSEHEKRAAGSKRRRRRGVPGDDREHTSSARARGSPDGVPWSLLTAIWLLAVVVRFALAIGDRVVWGDEPFYLWLGRNWIAGKGFAFVGHADVHHGPLFPLLAGLLNLLTNDLALASATQYIILGATLVLPIYAIGSELYGQRTGIAAASLTAVFPALSVSILHWGTLTEPLYMLFIYLGLWSALVVLRPFWPSSARGPSARMPDGVAVDGPLWAYALSGFSFGLAYLTRPEAVGYLVVVGMFMLVITTANRRRSQRHFWPAFARRMLAYLGAFSLAFIPYAIYVHAQTGSWMVSEKVGVAYLTGIGLAQGDTAAFDRATWGLDSTGLETFFFSSESYNVSMTQLILDDPDTFLKVLYLNVQRFVRVYIDWTLFPYLFLPLPVLGLFSRGWTRERTFKELYLVLSFLPVLGFILFYIQARYLVPFIPVMILWSARGLSTISDWLVSSWAVLSGRGDVRQVIEGRRWRRHYLSRAGRIASDAAPILLAMSLLLALHPLVLGKVTSVGSFRPAHRDVGQYLSNLIPRDAVIMSRYPAIAFHADSRWVPTPNASWPEVLRYARHKRADYMAVDQRELPYRPQFSSLISGEQIPPQLELVYEDTGDEQRLVVYKLLPKGD